MPYRTIDTAPKDGTVIWATSSEWMVLGCRMKWSAEGERWLAYFGEGKWFHTSPEPRYWMPYTWTAADEGSPAGLVVMRSSGLALRNIT